SSSRPATRSNSRQNFIDRRKQSVQHRHIHYLIPSPPQRYLDRFPDNSCPICDPQDDTTSPGYQKVINTVRAFDPNITISGKDQNNYYIIRENRKHTLSTLQQYLETLTFWRIPAEFNQLARTIKYEHHDTVVGEVHDLTEALEENYITEVDAYLRQQEQEQYQISAIQPVNYPPTPNPVHSTPVIRRQLSLGRRLFNTAVNLFDQAVEDSDDRLTVQARDSIGINDDDLPQNVLTDQERVEFGIENPESSSSEGSNTESEEEIE